MTCCWTTSSRSMTTAMLRPLFAELSDGLLPLVAAVAADGPAPAGGPFGGPHEVEHQRRAVMAILEGLGFDPDGWRLDVAPHPFAQRIGARRRAHHHALRPARLHRRAVRLHARVRARALRGRHPGPAGAQPARLDRSRSACTSRRAGCGRTSSAAAARSAPGCSRGCASTCPRCPRTTTADELYRGLNAVHRSLIRVEADETTYNLHIVLRFELELALMEGTLAVADLPHAWNDGRPPPARRSTCPTTRAACCRTSTGAPA